ncbi:MAG: hypothetical protein K8S99_06405 [Planctomycetes bacterium]|nr:hypothetical protein [Planctomycetota bacterium]
MGSNNLLSSIRRTQAEMLKAQEQLSTGKMVNRPSDSPSSTSAILLLQKILLAREQTDRNLENASGLLDNVDQALSDASDLTIQATTVASSQVGVGSSAETRKNQAGVIDAQIQALIDIANRQYQGVSLFGGSTNPGDSKPVFVAALGGVRYIGTNANLSADVGLGSPLEVNSNGADAFNAFSSRVQSTIDLNPQAAPDTRLADINGVTGEGFTAGSVKVTIDGTIVVVDLANAETLDDVTTRINNAINGVDGSAGSLTLSSTGYSLTAAAGHAIRIEEIGTGVTATGLGLALTANGSTVAGGDLDPKLTSATSIAALGGTLDLTSGLKITQGLTTKIASFGSATTIQDMMNTVSGLNLGLRLEVNAKGTGLNLISDVSGVELSIGENGGGTTATDLGLRTFGLDTELSTFRGGLGVANQSGEDDFQVRLHNGSNFSVNIDGLTTVRQVITAIQTAATTAGLNVGDPGQAGTDFNIGLASDGNGFVLEDGTAGGNDFRVMQLKESLAADNLGIYKNAGSAGSIRGDDNAKVRVESVFTHLMQLRDALVNNDSSGITLAGSKVEGDTQALVKARADVGVRSQRVTQQQSRSGSLKIAESSLLSNLQDADVTQVITNFTQLQTQLQATLQIGAQNMQRSLLDYLT